MAAKKNGLSEMISVRLTEDDVAKLTELSEVLPIKRITIARIALRVGLAMLAKDPTKMLDATLLSARERAKRKPKRRAKG